MIGNDIIDLKLAARQSNWKRKGFLDKIFTTVEQNTINSNTKPELMVWLLWSMKEAAYKIYNRETGHRGYFPHLLSCTLTSYSDNSYKGFVNYKDKSYYTSTEISDDMLHTVAVENVVNLNNINSIERASVTKDKSGIPYLITEKGLIPISISHHGRFSKTVKVKRPVN